MGNEFKMTDRQKYLFDWPGCFVSPTDKVVNTIIFLYL